jgi:hypothetical protein
MFSIGDYVKFIYTGEDGEVKALYPDGMLDIYVINDRETRPAFPDDIVLAKDFTHIVRQGKPKKEKPVVVKPLSTAELFNLDEKDIDRAEHGQKISQKNKPEIPQKLKHGDLGLFVAFEAQDEEKFLVRILNDSNYSFEFSYTLTVDDYQHDYFKHHIPPYEQFPVGELEKRHLNHKSNIVVSIPSFNYKQEVKLKASTFFSSNKRAPLLNYDMYVHQLSGKNLAKNSKVEVNTSDLSAYTKQNLPQEEVDFDTYANIHDVAGKASFVAEIDLHIEKLTPLHEKMAPGDKLNLQVKAFEEYLDEAIRLGMEHFFVIHGVGSGRLREAVAIRLKRNKQVAAFKNEHHPKYGFGATEVILAEKS